MVNPITDNGLANDVTISFLPINEVIYNLHSVSKGVKKAAEKHLKQESEAKRVDKFSTYLGFYNRSQDKLKNIDPFNNYEDCQKRLKDCFKEHFPICTWSPGELEGYSSTDWDHFTLINGSYTKKGKARNLN